MKRLDIGAFRSVFLCLAVSMPLHGAKAEEPKVTLIRMTIDELLAQGIAYGALTGRLFPNSCRSSGNEGLSVSDRLLEHFKGGDSRSNPYVLDRARWYGLIRRPAGNCLSRL